MMRRIALMLVVVHLLCLNASADQVTLKNGDRLTGSIVRYEGDSLFLRSEFFGEVKILWAAVEQISSSDPLYVTSKDGQLFIGPLTTSGSGIEIETKEAGRVALAKEAIGVIRSRDEQAARELQLKRQLDPDWVGFVDAGLSTTRGNADTLVVTLGSAASRTGVSDKLSVYAASLFARNGTTGRTETTAQAIRGGARYDRNISDRLFAFALSDLESDKFQDLDLRLVLGGGLGYHARRTERTRLDLFAGGTFNQEYFDTGLRRKSAEALFGEELLFRLNDRVTLTERAVVFPNLSDFGEYRFNFDSTAAARLTRNLSFQVTLSDRYSSNPIPGIKKNDLLLSTGLRLTFGEAGAIK